MSNNNVKKLVQEEVQKLRMQINEDIRKMQIFSEAYLLILLDLALINDPCERLIKVLNAVSTDFPRSILEIYVKRCVARAKKANIEFEVFADCLIQGLGDRVRELTLVDEIARVYGFKAGERWKAIIENSNTPETSDCPCKALNETLK